MTETIEQVVMNGLCCGCGTCAGVCPAGAIRMEVVSGLYVPKIEEDECNRCRVCVKSCPGHSVDFKVLCSKIFGGQAENAMLGNYLRCYVGHASDNDIRHNSSSGGIISQLLIFALEHNIIDGALIVRMKRNNPLEPEAFIAKTREEIIAASKSKYCPTAANEAIKRILKENGRFAVVGLPCHIHGIRKAERLHKILEEKIVLHIGLMCSHTVNFIGTEFLLERMHIRKEQVKALVYRGKGWPGALSAQVNGQSESAISYTGGWNAYWPIFSSFFFVPIRCAMCPDLTNELADISSGDAWLPELKRKKSGESVVIARTKKAEEILALMISAKALCISCVDPEKVRQSQALELKFKKDDLAVRLSIFRLFGNVIPVFNPEARSVTSVVAVLRALFHYFNIKVSSNDRFRILLLSVPFPLFRLYFGIRRFLYAI